MQDQHAELEWRDGDVPVSSRFDDPYFSLENGLDETRHVFLGGNDLPARFRDGFHVAELGFGTGLNFLTALRAWRDAGIEGRLRYTSFEAFPMVPSEMQRALSVFPNLPVQALDLGTGTAPFRAERTGPDFHLRVIVGDARQTLPAWDGEGDAWFLDGFSPAKNPELWEESLLMQVGHHTAPGGTVATYTAAGFVRRGLAAAGFAVERVAGYGRKRHMTRARKV